MNTPATTHELFLYRKWYTANTTIGELFINGTKLCFILEDVCRDLNRDGDLTDPGEAKVAGKTAIPAGRYQVIIDRSTRFKRDMPHVLNVPEYQGIRIHPGNWAKDTEGCLLTGTTRGTDYVGQSQDAYDKLMIRLKALLTTKKVYINIIDMPVTQHTS